MSSLKSRRLVFGCYLVLLIVSAELLLGYFGLPGWPAFMVMILFFMAGMDVKKVPHILVGGLCGIAWILGAKLVLVSLGPVLGVEAARTLFVMLVVFSIVAFGEVAPMFFNNYAFLFLTTSTVAAAGPKPNPLLWMAVELVGGAAMIAGVVGIAKLMTPRAASGAAPATEARDG